MRSIFPLFPLLTAVVFAQTAPGPDPARAVIPLKAPADPKLPTLFLIGDSTVRNGINADGSNGQWGWGEPLAAFFDPKKINVVNRAVGGLSSRTYLTSGHWEQTLVLVKPGDFVVMQFGHNDNGPTNDNSRARGTLKGAGDETESIDNRLTHQPEVVHTYGWYLKKFIADARAKGATPIVCSLVPRKAWRDGKVVRERYVEWAADAAKATGTAYIDLNGIIAARYEALGPKEVEPLFADPQTHTSLAGAELNAECVVSGLKGLPGRPFEKYLSSKGKEH